MKYCPLCESQYSDETLRFCLQDGTTLTSNVRQSSIDTVAFSNPLTIEKFQQTEEMRVNFPNQTQNRVEPVFVAPTIQTQTKHNKSLRMFWTVGLPVLVVFGAFGLGSWFYLNKQNQALKRNSEEKVVVQNPVEKNLLANTSIAPAETAAENPKQPEATNSENNEAKKEVTDFINSWKKAFESRNLADFTAKYAEKVDYYEKSQTDLKEIRNEIQKTFTDYKEIEITLNNIRIAVDNEDDKATAVFDKEWSFETDKDLSEGKAHIKLQFQKNGAEWKIVSEQNLKTYYTEN